MAPIKKIRDHFYYRDLERHQQSPDPASSFNSLNKIVFILPVSGCSLLEAFFEFTRKWSDGGSDPRIVVFGTEKDPPDTNVEMTYLVRKDIDWKGVANKKKTDELVKSEFDVLINMDNTGIRPMEHLSASIPASLKIGLGETKHKIYDILVETDTDDMLHNLRAIDQVLANLQS